MDVPKMQVDVRELFTMIGERDAEIYALNKLVAEQKARIEELLDRRPPTTPLKEVIE